MARKAVLEGGKRDEIIRTAMGLFFEHGYEATSVRMIMDKVGGEIGMFYHYFKSKDMLFDCVAEYFFKDFREKCEKTVSECTSPDVFAEKFLPLYEEGMAQFDKLKGHMHWTIQFAMHARTVASLVPFGIALIDKFGIKTSVPKDILAGQLIYGISATLHSESFAGMDDAQKKECPMEYINKLLDK